MESRSKRLHDLSPQCACVYQKGLPLLGGSKVRGGYLPLILSGSDGKGILITAMGFPTVLLSKIEVGKSHPSEFVTEHIP